MKKFNISADRVCRHYDVSRKNCPGSWSANNWNTWKKFKEEIQEKIIWNIDLSKDSIFGVHHENKTETSVVNDVENLAEQEEKRLRHLMKEGKRKSISYEKNGLKIIETDLNNIYIQHINGNTLRQIGAYGVNGGVFGDTTTKGIWSIAINNGKALGENSLYNDYKGRYKRGTLICQDNRITLELINNITESPRISKVSNIDWAVGGFGTLFPMFDLDLEKIPKMDRDRTNRTALAFKGRVVYLIVAEKLTYVELREKILKTLNIDGAIALDGGGSTQMLYENNFDIHSNRKLSTIVGIKEL